MSERFLLWTWLYKYRRILILEYIDLFTHPCCLCCICTSLHLKWMRWTCTYSFIHSHSLIDVCVWTELRYSTVWYGTVWYCISCNTVQYGIIQCSMILRVIVHYGLVQYDILQYGIVSHIGSTTIIRISNNKKNVLFCDCFDYKPVLFCVMIRSTMVPHWYIWHKGGFSLDCIHFYIHVYFYSWDEVA